MMEFMNALIFFGIIIQSFFLFTSEETCFSLGLDNYFGFLTSDQRCEVKGSLTKKNNSEFYAPFEAIITLIKNSKLNQKSILDIEYIGLAYQRSKSVPLQEIKSTVDIAFQFIAKYIASNNYAMYVKIENSIIRPSSIVISNQWECNEFRLLPKPRLDFSSPEY